MMTSLAPPAERRLTPQERWAGAAARPDNDEEIALTSVAIPDPPKPAKRTRRRFTAKDAGVLLCRVVAERERAATESAATILGALQGLGTVTNCEGAASVLRHLISSTKEGAADDIAEYERAVTLLAPHAPPHYRAAVVAPLYELVALLHARGTLTWTLERPAVEDPGERPRREPVDVERIRDAQEAETKLGALRDQRSDIQSTLDTLADRDIEATCPLCAQALTRKARAEVLDLLQTQIGTITVDERFYERRLGQLVAPVPEDVDELPDFMRKPASLEASDEADVEDEFNVLFDGSDDPALIGE